MGAVIVRDPDCGGLVVSRPVAAIDCGTNSIRLLVARPGDGALVDVDRRMLVVRLGEGIDRTGVIARPALERTFAACRRFAEVLAGHDVAALRFVATSATRDAGNAAEFLAGVRQILGVTPEVITGQEEAELSFTGATRGLPHQRPVLVFDIGGGSTEFMLGDDQAATATSVPMGCVRFHERFLRSDPVTPAEVARAETAIDEILDGVMAVVPVAGARDVIGTAGTVTTVAALALGLPAYDADRIHGTRVPVADVAAVRDRLVAMSLALRRALPVMHPGRADVIVSGAIILHRILQRIGADHVVASEHDILDGIAWSLVLERA